MKLFARLLRKKVFLVILVVLICAGIGAVWFAHWGATPSETTVHIDSTAPASIQAPSYQPLIGQFATTSVPSGWKTHINNSTAASEQILSFAPSPSNGQAGFTFNPLPSGGIAEISAYTIRAQNNVDYQAVPSAQASVSKLFWDKTGNGGYTAFIVRGNRCLVLSVSQTGSQATDLNLLTHIVDNLAWK